MSLQIQVTADVANAGKQIEDFSKKSRIALTNLSLVAQDLPFGFIGIQNNLPGVISSFGELTKEAGGLKGALKQIGTSLVGPAGLFLAFSAVTAGVTFLIQKYGSLGNAVTVLLSKNTLLTKSQLDYNKSLEEGFSKIGGEIGQINVLVARLSNLKLSNDQRIDSYYALKKIAPEIVGLIREENALTTESITLINLLANARIEYIKLKVRENSILSTLDKTQSEVIKKETALGLSKRKLIDLENELNQARKSPNTRTRALIEAQLKNKIEDQNKTVSEARTELYKVYKVQDSYYKILDPVIGKISEYDDAARRLSETLKEQNKVTKEAKAIKPAKELDIAELERKGRYAALKLQEQADKNRLKYLQDQLKLEQQITKETFAQADKDMKADAEEFTKVNFKNLEKVTKPLADLQKKLEEAKFLLNEVFFNPLQDAFMNLFETGKFAFKAFGDAVLKQIQQLVSKIIATGIISLISNLLFPGVGVAAGGASLFAKIGADILGAIGLGGGGVANPSFGGVGPGSMGMSGQVNVVLRGSDLVGALNRTNATINRVG